MSLAFFFVPNIVAQCSDIPWQFWNTDSIIIIIIIIWSPKFETKRSENLKMQDYEYFDQQGMCNGVLRAILNYFLAKICRCCGRVKILRLRMSELPV